MWFMMVDQLIYALLLVWFVARNVYQLSHKDIALFLFCAPLRLLRLWTQLVVACGQQAMPKHIVANKRVLNHIAKIYATVRQISSLDALQSTRHVLGETLAQRVASELETIRRMAGRHYVEIKRIRQISVLYSLGSRSVLQVEADVLDYALDANGQIVRGSKTLKRVNDKLVVEKMPGQRGRKNVWKVKDIQKQDVEGR